MKPMRTANNLFRRALLPAALGAAVALPAQAQNNWELEEIIVTAQKRAQSLQDVPISVSAVSGEKMSEAGTWKRKWLILFSQM